MNLLAAGFCATAALMLGACQTAGPAGTSATRATIKSPNAEKWLARPNPAGGVVYVCRPLACPEPSAVLVAFRRAPTRSPDTAALQIFARDIVPSQIAAANVQMSAHSSGYNSIRMVGRPRTTTLRDHPAVTVETLSTGNGKPQHGIRGYIFAGNALIDIYSRSHSPATARTNFQDFVENTTIDDQKF